MAKLSRKLQVTKGLLGEATVKITAKDAHIAAATEEAADQKAALAAEQAAHAASDGKYQSCMASI